MAQSCKTVNNFLVVYQTVGSFLVVDVFLHCSRINAFESETGVDVEPACLVFAGSKLKYIPSRPTHYPTAKLQCGQ